MPSISFDRAAEFYDETRTLAPEAHEALIEILSEELRPRGPVLEIGVGTGRFAVPLAENGIPMFGVDLSHAMVGKLIEKQVYSSNRTHVTIGDATHLPFAGLSFGAALGVHVLHLISEWQEVVDELIRVVLPGGVLLFDLGVNSAEEKAVDQLVRERFGRRLHIGVYDFETLESFMVGRGLTPKKMPVVNHSRRFRPSAMVERVASNKFSFTWTFTDDERASLAADVERLLKAAFGDMEEIREIESKIQIRAFDVPR